MVSATMTEASRADWAVLTDHNVAIRFAVFDHHVDFRVFDAAEGQSCINGKWTDPEWGLFDGSSDFAFAEWEQAEWELSGYLKWDGCINWQTNPECMVHGCSPRHVDWINAVFGAVYAYGKRHFDLLGDEAPPMPSPALEFAG